jgi:hypothetical protein
MATATPPRRRLSFALHHRRPTRLRPQAPPRRRSLPLSDGRDSPPVPAATAFLRADSVLPAGAPLSVLVVGAPPPCRRPQHPPFCRRPRPLLRVGGHDSLPRLAVAAPPPRRRP